jgi:ferredoxin-NADP reductase
MYPEHAPLLRNPSSPSFSPTFQVFHVIYSNTNWDDILLRDELAKLAKKHPARLKLYHTLSREQPAKWTQGVGRITLPMFEQIFPKGGADTSGFVCGSQGFNSTAIGFLKQMGYDEGKIGVF